MVVRVGLIGTSWWADAMYAPPLAAHGCTIVDALALVPIRAFTRTALALPNMSWVT